MSHNPIGSAVKRLFDVAGAAAGMIVAAPILVAAAIAIRRESPGPAIYAQSRVGRNGQVFTCYKLRTMVQGTADLPTHLTRASAVTAVGARLRRLKLDELPQLYNVLIGEMSLVGPRPCLPSQHELIEARTRHGALAVRPGITGLAQVQGIDMSQPQRLAEVDGRYVATMTFLGDLRLLLATLSGRGTNVDRVKQTSA